MPLLYIKREIVFFVVHPDRNAEKLQGWYALDAVAYKSFWWQNSLLYDPTPSEPWALGELSHSLHSIRGTMVLQGRRWVLGYLSFSIEHVAQLRAAFAALAGSIINQTQSFNF